MGTRVFVRVCVFSVCICPHLCLCLSLSVIQMCLRRGKFLPTYFPGDPNQTWPETRKTERHNDRLVKRLTAPQADFCNAISSGRLTKY